MDLAEFWKGFHRTWSICDATWADRDELLDTLRESFFQLPCTFLEDQADQEFYASLPDRLTIYRGCDMDRVMGLAWTTDRDVALGFAKGHRGIELPNPVLASAFVRKHSIFGAYQQRMEHEIVIDPLWIYNIRIRFVS